MEPLTQDFYNESIGVLALPEHTPEERVAAFDTVWERMLELEGRESADVPLFDIQRCRVCGCTDDRACPGGCSWVEDDLCSRCAGTHGAPEGLFVKYVVVKVEDGKTVYDCFVLRPDRDPAAVMALRAYAEATANDALAGDIREWLGRLWRKLEMPEVVALEPGAVVSIETDGRKFYAGFVEADCAGRVWFRDGNGVSLWYSAFEYDTDWAVYVKNAEDTDA